jgi:hypothetical protein
MQTIQLCQSNFASLLNAAQSVGSNTSELFVLNLVKIPSLFQLSRQYHSLYRKP